MTIQRIHEDPRVTRPYDDEQWGRIERLGYDVDRVLSQGDARLTMGGEPTFVSIDDMDGPEWNMTALGPDKRRLAGKLFTKLAERFAHAPLLHYGQGKWYPGESLPRWVLGCFWRKDREPIWLDNSLIARDEVDYGVDERDAQRFITALATRLGVEAEYTIPAYEDVWYYLWKSRRLPINVDPLDSKLSDPEERNRLAKVFEQGLEKIVGYTLPLRPLEGWVGQPSWETGPWFLRQEHMFLLPGDSPMGLRLPLDSIPWIAKQDRQPFIDVDPYAPRGALLPYHQLMAPPGSNGYYGGGNSGNGGNGSSGAWRREPVRQFAGVAGSGVGGTGIGTEPWTTGPGDGGWGHNLATAARLAPLGSPRTWTKPEIGQSAKNLVRTAICVEARAGLLNVFMPPLEKAEEYLHLVSAIEQTARELSMPVRPRRVPAAERSSADQLQGHARSWCDRSQSAASQQLVRNRREHDRALRRGPPMSLGHGKIHGRRTPHWHRRRQPYRARRRDSARQPVFAPARSAGQPDHLLEQSAVALVLVLGLVHWPHQPGASCRRSTARKRLRVGNGLGAIARWRYSATMDRGPGAAKSAGGRDREHSPHRVLYRQVVLAR